ncbi:MAG: HlyD family efflux transporter periplasmic adaptor subunit [Proteobacteria bacterium]|nr:HlyD family efflux transporter periplasmic adaptor subunit [Pseudomonadota bacterium]
MNLVSPSGITFVITFISLVLTTELNASTAPLVQVEVLNKIDISDEYTYPARVTSKVKGELTSDIEGIVVKVVAGLGQKVGRGATVLMIKNTDPVYEYVPVRVNSPVNGLVSQLDVTEGSVIRKGAKLGTVIDPSQTVIETEVPAVDLAFFRKGMNGKFVWNESSEAPVQISGVSPVVDPITGTASAQMNPVGNTIPLGVIGRVVFKANQRKGVLVAEQALVMRGNEIFIRIVENSKAKVLPVKIASIKKGMAEIAEGLKGGETVVIGTSKFISDGQEVTIQQSDVAKK